MTFSTPQLECSDRDLWVAVGGEDSSRSDEKFLLDVALYAQNRFQPK